MTQTHAPSHTAVRRPFHTPVRGHVYAHRPPGGPGLAAARLVLRREPDNPADPWAVAVWADGGGVPWRVGYLDRGVAARLGPRLDGAGELPAAWAGWTTAPGGWERPLVRVGTDLTDVRLRPSVRELPPFANRSPVTAA